jgi:PAS domain S-box-containing protein
LLDAIDAGVVAIGGAGRIDFANAAAAALIGCAVDDLLGRPAIAALGIDLEGAPRSGAQAAEATLRRCDGRAVPVELRIAPLEGGARGAVAMFTDISARRAAEEEAASGNRQLWQALRELAAGEEDRIHAATTAAIARLAAGVAHGVNNPVGFLSSNLAVLETYASLLLPAAEGGRAAQRPSEEELDFLRADVPALIDECRSGVRRIARIVQSLRVFSRVDGPGESDSYDLGAGVDSVLALLAHEIAGRATIECAFDELPLVEGVGEDINQVLLGLVSNALRAVGEGGRVAITGRSLGGQVRLEVADNGCGMSPDELEALFEPFLWPVRPRDSVGFALAVARRIVRRHGGDLSVVSTEGEGTVVSLLLPIAGAPGDA